MSCNRFFSYLILLVFSAVISLPVSAQITLQQPAQGNTQNAPRSEKTETPESHAGDARNHAGNENDSPIDKSELQDPILWHDPGTIASLDLFYGQGGKQGRPDSPFTFESEDATGSNPK